MTVHFNSVEAVEYGNRFGFLPHRDFRHASRLLEGIDPAGRANTFEFGRDGVPCYVNGPYDTPERMRDISQRVAAQGGHFELIENASELKSAFSEHYDDDIEEPAGYLDEPNGEDSDE